MRRALVKCGEVQTEVITKGRWIEEDPLPHSSKHVVLVVPGNPGVSLFYQDFIKAIDAQLPQDTPVWIVGHAGHVQPPENLDIAMPSSDKWDECYGLTAQVQHKVEFVKKYIPEDAQIHLIGHSIGAWIILNMLKDHDIDKRTSRCYLLFPTIERMAETRNGRLFSNILSPLASVLIFLSWIFTMTFPSFLQKSLIRIFGLFYGIPIKYITAVQQMIHPKVLNRIIKLAKEEMKFVREADDENISKHKDKLWFYYGSRDGWVPVRYYKNMISRHSNLNAQLCQRGFLHSFVLKDDKSMGHIVGDLINEQCLTDSKH